MFQKTEAIVLNKIKYNDFSFIVNLYSREFGRFSTIVKIPKSKNNNNFFSINLFTSLNIIDTEIDIKNTRNIQNLKYCNRAEILNSINNDVFKICIAQFIAEVMIKTIREEEPRSNLYDFVKETILLLENVTGACSNIHLLFLKEFAKAIGFGITNNYCEETPYFNFREGMFIPVYTYDDESLDIQDSKILSYILTMEYANIKDVVLNYSDRKKLLAILIRYYEKHALQLNEIKSLKVLNEVFSD
jgi:DNA repair protein RecO (recombination protein O)